MSCVITSGLLFLVSILVLLACGYGHKPFFPEPPPNKPYSSFVVELNDYGTFWRRDKAQDALNEVDRQSKETNTIVVLYVHGWHHNAAPDNSNLAAFHKSLKELKDKLDKKPYEEARLELTGKADLKVIGIYLGWRGRSLPLFFDYLTFWRRKAAAERVGAGDAREFILRLQKTYDDRNRLGYKKRAPFMGLITVGHSFGGQVLFNSVSQTTEAGLIGAAQRLAGEPQDSSQPINSLTGIGDITVLINPALEAYQFERIHQLYSALRYDCVQTPILLVVSGEDDSARQFWFPLARWSSGFFRPGFPNDVQRELWHRSLGEHEAQRTHRLETTNATNSLSVDDYSKHGVILNFDFTAKIALGGGSLMPLKHIPYSPVVVAYSSRDLVQGHTGIFTETFHGFLIDYVAFVEGKRMLVRRFGESAANQACH